MAWFDDPKYPTVNRCSDCGLELGKDREGLCVDCDVFWTDMGKIMPACQSLWHVLGHNPDITDSSGDAIDPDWAMSKVFPVAPALIAGLSKIAGGGPHVVFANGNGTHSPDCAPCIARKTLQNIFKIK